MVRSFEFRIFVIKSAGGGLYSWQADMKADHPLDPAAQFLELLEPIEGQLEGYCRRLIWDPQEAADALHNALVRAIAAFDRYRAGTNFRAWMYKILTHEVFALNRKHGRIAAREFQMDPVELELLAAQSPGGGGDGPTDSSFEAFPELLDEDLLQALNTLAVEERATLLLRAIGGFKYREMAETLEMPMGSVMGYLGRARRKMRLALARRQRPAAQERLL